MLQIAATATVPQPLTAHIVVGPSLSLCSAPTRTSKSIGILEDHQLLLQDMANVAGSSMQFLQFPLQQ